MNRLRFWWRYLRRNTPWDTNITPPEIVALADRLPVGTALDLGCGTGTNVIYLAQRGWRAVGVDFAPNAIGIARRKARKAGVEAFAKFYVADVTKLSALERSVYAPFTFAMDIGCLHALSPEQQRAYAAQLARLTARGATYALYAHQRRNQAHFSFTPEHVKSLFEPHFTLISATHGTDTSSGLSSAWYELQRV
ncbi:MAG: class I SAM-dependent methyltransferase [Anaerolineae bacterium]|nr:class I SAM-dependent methyltransferase [Anaerolineae bacterium]MDW8299944.1 class I SAM-dependent methyltransferase [Anaerolineae bacterium]